MNERVVDVGLETVTTWAKALEKDEQMALLKELADAGADADLETAIAKRVFSPEIKPEIILSAR